MSRRKVVVIGASAGGVEALTTLAAALPADLPAPVLVVLHIPPDSPSLLAQILDRRSQLNAKEAEDGETARNSVLYVPPPDRHLLIDVDYAVRTPRGPRENRHRPAIDPLFRSAALAGGADTIGVVLSGNMDDGTAGLIAVKKCGGVAIVQEPSDAIYPGMPQSAIEHVDVDHVLPVSLIASQIVRSIEEDRQPLKVDRRLIVMEKKISEFTRESIEDDDRPGQPSAFSCPDCGGVLWEIEEEGYVRFRCRVGHAFSPDTMLGAQGEVLEEALNAALKTLDESARVAHRLCLSERSRGHDWIANRFAQREYDARERAEVIRRFIRSGTATVPVEAEEPQLAAKKSKRRS